MPASEYEWEKPLSEKGPPNEFEELILLTLIRLGDSAYGVNIRTVMEQQLGRSVSIAGVYTALDRLECEGLVCSWVADPTPERGGRAKKYFRLEASGAEALLEKHKAMERLWDGIPELLRDSSP